jgi:hypothetical protein
MGTALPMTKICYFLFISWKYYLNAFISWWTLKISESINGNHRKLKKIAVHVLGRPFQ